MKRMKKAVRAVETVWGFQGAFGRVARLKVHSGQGVHSSGSFHGPVTLAVDLAHQDWAGRGQQIVAAEGRELIQATARKPPDVAPVRRCHARSTPPDETRVVIA